MVPHVRTAGTRDAIDEKGRGARPILRPARLTRAVRLAAIAGTSALLLSACGSGEL